MACRGTQNRKVENIENVEKNVIIAQRFASKKMVALHLLGIWAELNLA